MSKIIYHKFCRRHEYVSKAKRMLNAIEKKFGGFEGKFYCNIELTGVNQIDRNEVKRLIELHLNQLKKNIDKQLLQNQKLVNGEWNEGYEEGFYIPPFTDQLQIVEELSKVYWFMFNNYPELETKKTYEFLFASDRPQDKISQAKRWFKQYPVEGFLPEIFVRSENGSTSKIYPLTFSESNFECAKSLFVQYL